MKLTVKRIAEDGWGRPRLRNIENGRIYADISLGKSEKHLERGWQPYPFNIAGDWHTTTCEGEPDCRIRQDAEFIVVD